MDLIWINASEKLKDGVKLANQINDESFNTILDYIYKTTQAATQNSNLTKELEAIEQIKENCSLKSPEFTFVIKTLSFIVKRSSNFIMKPTKLQTDLKDNIGLDENKTEIFLKYWKNITKPVLDNLEDSRKSDVSNQLEDVLWDLKVQLSSSGQQKEKTALGSVQLKSKTGDPINLEMNHTELLGFYEQLENIQVELDLLKK